MWTKFERNVIKAVTLQPLNEANCFPDVSRELKGDHAQIISVVILSILLSIFLLTYVSATVDKSLAPL